MGDAYKLDGPKKCAPGCEKRGNCNAELGVCQCPFGWEGPTCEESYLQACQLAPGKELLRCSDVQPKSCECARQCVAHFCRVSPEGHRICRPTFGVDPKCFEVTKPEAYAKAVGEQMVEEGKPPVKDVPVGRIFSDVPPEHLAESGAVTWHANGNRDGGRAKLDAAQATEMDWWGKSHAVPLRNCRDFCNWRGQCLRVDSSNNTVCQCEFGFAGEACETLRQDACLHSCNDQGTCVGGFCHCKPGRWGQDCSRTTAHPKPEHPILTHTKLKIYIYELPTHITYQWWPNAAYQGIDPIYSAYQHFMQLMYKDWAVRTENPWEANLFYVPLHSYSFTSNLGGVAEHAVWVLEHLRQEYPFWNVTGGKDHFFWLTNDRGMCYLPADHELVEPPIKLVHFGLHRQTGLPDHYFADTHACLNPLRDVVATPYWPGQDEGVRKTFIDTKYDPAAIPTGKLLFFAGGLRLNEPAYSGGARQAMFNTFKDNHDPDIRIEEGFIADYQAVIRSSKFCFAPYGHGWGIRLGQYMSLGCVPVIVQDKVVQMYEDVLPYHEFSLRLHTRHIPHIGHILRNVSDEELRMLRNGVQKYWPAFVWDTSVGGMAYNYTLFNLRMRLTALLADHWRRRLHAPIGGA